MVTLCVCSFLWLWSPCVYAPSSGCGHLVCMPLPLVVVTLCVCSFLWLWSPCVYAPSSGCGHLVCMPLPLVVVTLCVWLCTALLLMAAASTALCCCLFSSRLLMYCLPFFVPNSWTTWSSLQCLSPSWPCLAWTRFTSTIATLLSEHWPINYLVEYSHILRYASAYGMNVGGPSRTHPFCCHVTDIGCKEGHSY